MTDSRNIIADDDRKVIDEIKARVPIVDFLRKRGHKLIRSGPNRWKMLCPFHDEKTPSCSVSEAYNHFKCFGCGKSGDIFTYLEEKEGMTFSEAVEMYADQLGIAYRRHPGSEVVDRKALRRIVELTAKAYRNMYERLDENHAAKRNIADRHIPTSDKDNHNLFGWSGADDRVVVKALNKEGFTDEQIINAGVAKKDRNGVCRMLWRDRLTFVINDLMGHPVGFTGRTVYGNTTDPRKYVNSSDSPIFHKSAILFAADIAKVQAAKENLVYVVEGQFDVIAMQHAHMENTVASSGTAFTVQHAALLKRMVGENGRIVFAFDSDAAGQKAALRTFKTSPSIQYMSYATIIDGDKDASDMYRDDPESLSRQMQDIKPLYEHIIDWMASENNLSTEAGRAAYVNGCMDAYHTITDPILADNYITYMGLVSGIDSGTIRARAGKPPTASPQDDQTGMMADNAQAQPEDYMLALCYEQPDLRKRLREVSMSGWRETARRRIISNEPLPDKVLDFLMDVDDSIRRIEKYAPLADVDELFNSQKQIIMKRRRDSSIMDYHQRMMKSITGDTNVDNVVAYAKGVMKAASAGETGRS